MFRQQQRVLESFRRAAGFFTAHPELIPQAEAAGQQPALATQVDVLNGVIARTSAINCSDADPYLRSTYGFPDG